MKSLWGKISKYSYYNNNTEGPQSPTANQKQPKTIVIDYYNLKSIEQKLHSLTSIQMFQLPNSKVANIFQDIMSTLHGLLNVIIQLKQQQQRNTTKLQDYERMKNLLSQHSQIIKHLQQQSSNNLNRIYQQKRQQNRIFQQKIKDYQQKLLQQNNQLKQLQKSIIQKDEQIAILKQKLDQKQIKQQKTQKQLQQSLNKIKLINIIEDNSLKFQNKIQFGKYQLSTILIYSKNRKIIYQFIGIHDFINLSLINKQINLICIKTIKKQYIPILIKNKNKCIENIGKDMKQYQKILDSFPMQNIRNNAIKYLFFKIKPGSYMLPYFQSQQQPNQKIQQKSKLSQLSSFFRKKNQQPSKQKHLNFQHLKNDHEFKQIQKRVDFFFDKLFGIQATTDLKIFNQTMKRQLSQLRNQLKTGQKSIQLLCMSRYLYLQINQLNNLLQVCFALLINKHNDLKQIKKKNDDLTENDKVLRNLVENIANDREQVQKRIFYLQNQNIKNKNIQQRLQDEIKTLRQSEQSKKQQNQHLSSYVKQIKQKMQNNDKKIKNWEQSWQQAVSLIKQIRITDVMSE